jgi:hypothetical protein
MSGECWKGGELIKLSESIMIVEEAVGALESFMAGFELCQGCGILYSLNYRSCPLCGVGRGV